MTCQNAADVAATVLPRLCGRIARPCTLSTYTSTSSGCSPAQSASPKHRSARLTAAISAALVTLWEFAAAHKPRFGHAKPYLHSFVRIVPHQRLHACRSCPVSRTFASFRAFAGAGRDSRRHTASCVVFTSFKLPPSLSGLRLAPRPPNGTLVVSLSSTRATTGPLPHSKWIPIACFIRNFWQLFP